MPLILSDVGADEFLKTYFNNSRPGGGNNLAIRLFVNDISPVDTHVTADFTEAVGGGYVSKALLNGSWTVNPVLDPSEAVYSEQTWVFTGALSGGASIYGYYVLDAGNTLIWAERFSQSFTPSSNGDTLKIMPKFQMSKGTPS